MRESMVTAQQTTVTLRCAVCPAIARVPASVEDITTRMVIPEGWTLVQSMVEHERQQWRCPKHPVRTVAGGLPVEAVKEAAIAKAERGAPTGWLALAEQAVMAAAELGTFTTDDVWARLGKHGAAGTPPEPRALGAVMSKLAKAGRIAATSRYEPSARVACHGRPVRMWVAA